MTDHVSSGPKFINIKLFIPTAQRKRLTDQRFRMPMIPRAGEFAPRFHGPKDVLKLFRKKLLLDVNGFFESDGLGTLSVTHTDTSHMGWVRSFPIEELTDTQKEQTEWFNPNKKSRALRFLPTCTMKAPLTNDVTFVVRINKKSNNILASIETMYPGADIGDMRKNITNREKVVLFDPEHPGEPIT